MFLIFLSLIKKNSRKKATYLKHYLIEKKIAEDHKCHHLDADVTNYFRCF